MPLFLEHAQMLQLPDLRAGVLEAIITADELFNVIDFSNIAPFTRVEYTRESSLGSVDAAWVATTGATTESAPLFTHVADDVKVLITVVKVPKVNLGTDSEAAAIAQKAKQITRKFTFSALSGQDRTSTEIGGLSSLVKAVAAQSITAGSLPRGAALTRADLWKLHGLVEQYRQPSFFLSNGTVKNAYRVILDAAGGVDSAMKQLPNFGRPILTFEGVPWLRTEWQDQTEICGAQAAGDQGNATSAQTSSIYCVYSNYDDGYGAFFNGPSVIDVTGPIPVTLSDMVEYQIVMRVGTVLKSPYAMAVLRGVTG